MIQGKNNVLLVDDEKNILLSYSVMLRSGGIDNVVTIDDSRKVMNYLSDNKVSVMILDLNMPHISGLEILDKVRRHYSNTAVIIVTAINDIERAVECMKNGAIDYLVKPVEKNRFVSSVRNALELRHLQDEVFALRAHIASLKEHLFEDKLDNEPAFSSYLTCSKRMRSIFQYIESVSVSTEPILITGETGVGKELLAKIIHNVSGIPGEYVTVNAAGLDDTLFSDALFGHKKGAFTGADRDRKGLIEKASEGTLLLDEIGDLSELSQVKLLRLIEEGVYYPLGSDVAEKSSARIIACTNRNLRESMARGWFRKDLYYRLAALQIEVPPLRERKEDIAVLLDHFLEESAKSLKKKKPTPPKELVTLLSGYAFPGNVRELKAMIFDAVARHKSGVLSLKYFRKFIDEKNKDIPFELNVTHDEDSSAIIFSGRFPTLKEAEEHIVNEALKKSNGNQGIAASLLGISRQALNKRLTRAKKS